MKTKIKYNGILHVGGNTLLITGEDGFPHGFCEELAKLLPEGKKYCKMKIIIDVKEGESCLRVCQN